MSDPVGLRCVRCGATYEPGALFFGCPACADTVPANLEVVYDSPLPVDLRSRWSVQRPGLWRYADALPVPADAAISLGEGGTPLLDCRRAGEAIGLPDLLAKNESANPTWSFKDRLASVAVSWACSRGLPGIALSSSGNAGAAAAAYAARAGLPCLVLTTRAFPAGMQRFMRSFGAMVVAAPTGPDRWTLNRAAAREWGFLPVSNVTDPPVGSHPVAIEGCKTIAFEISQDLGWRPPDVVVVPVAYGDGLSGIHRGFQELRAAGVIDRLPRLVAVEAYPSLSGALAADAPGPVATRGSGSRAHSAAAPTGTFQALRALRESGGMAIAVGDTEIAEAHQLLREREGMFVEFSSAMPLAGVRRLVKMGKVAPDERVVLLVTSSGLKDADVTGPGGELPLADPTLQSLTNVLRDRYGFHA